MWLKVGRRKLIDVVYMSNIIDWCSLSHSQQNINESKVN